jgi:hypothetical protein
VAELQAQFPAVPIVFCETRPLADEWTYRWLGACQYELELVAGTSTLEESFSRAVDAYATAPPIEPKPATIRSWARQVGLMYQTGAGFHQMSERPGMRPTQGPSTKGTKGTKRQAEELASIRRLIT